MYTGLLINWYYSKSALTWLYVVAEIVEIPKSELDASNTYNTSALF